MTDSAADRATRSPEQTGPRKAPTPPGADARPRESGSYPAASAAAGARAGAFAAGGAQSNGQACSACPARRESRSRGAAVALRHPVPALPDARGLGARAK